MGESNQVKIYDDRIATVTKNSSVSDKVKTWGDRIETLLALTGP